MGIVVGETFEQTLILSEDDIIDFATRVEDFNPIHHDPDYAADTRFGNIIASGPHITALFQAMGLNYFSRYGTVQNLSFNVSFRAAVLPNVTLYMQWKVTAVEDSAERSGELVTLNGTVKDVSGTILLTGEAQLLIKP
jgi:acyl dehydratase